MKCKLIAKDGEEVERELIVSASTEGSVWIRVCDGANTGDGFDLLFLLGSAEPLSKVLNAAIRLMHDSCEEGDDLE
jgi:hypothetical protein